MIWNYKAVKIKIKYLQYSKSYRSYVCNPDVCIMNEIQLYDEYVQ